MRCSDGHAEHIPAVDSRLTQDLLDNRVDARCNIRGGGCFAGCADAATWRIGGCSVDDGSVGIGAADVDADAIGFHIGIWRIGLFCSWEVKTRVARPVILIPEMRRNSK